MGDSSDLSDEISEWIYKLKREISDLDIDKRIFMLNVSTDWSLMHNISDQSDNASPNTVTSQENTRSNEKHCLEMFSNRLDKHYEEQALKAGRSFSCLFKHF